MNFKRKAHVRTSRIVTSRCPNCGHLLEAVTGASVGSDEGELPEAPKPSPGDYTICAYCATLLKFDANMDQQIVPAEEVERACRQNELLSKVLTWKRQELTKRIAGLN